jgi:phosphonate transport system permease protein
MAVQRWGVLPQVLPEVIAFWLYRFEINLRAAAVLGVVGAGGIGTVLFNTLSYGRFDKAGTAIIVVVVGTIAVDLISGTIRRRVIEGSGGLQVSRPELMTMPETTGGGLGS